MKKLRYLFQKDVFLFKINKTQISLFLKGYYEIYIKKDKINL